MLKGAAWTMMKKLICNLDVMGESNVNDVCGLFLSIYKM